MPRLGTQARTPPSPVRPTGLRRITTGPFVHWDDLKFVLTVDREGGLAAAARALAINYSTAHRRLDGIERTLGVRLFQRVRSGYCLTRHGQAVSETARRVEAEILSVERQLVGTDQKLSGTIRVSTSHLLGLYFLPEMLRQFMQKYPEVKVKLAINDELANLSQSDADVVIRGTARPPPYLVGRSIAPIPYCAYVRRDLVFATPQRPLSDHEWIGFDNNDPAAPLKRWLDQIVPGARCRLTLDSAAGMREAVVRGLGAAVIPCLTGDQLPELARIGEVRVEPGFDLWILSHADLRRSARIKAFMKFMEETITSSPLVMRSAPTKNPG